MIKLLAVFVFMLLRNWTEKSEWKNNLKRVRIKSQLSETSPNKQKYKWIASLWNISYCRKIMWLSWIESTFTLASFVQEVPVFFLIKWVSVKPWLIYGSMNFVKPNLTFKTRVKNVRWPIWNFAECRPFCLANSGDPDQMQHYAVFHLGLCCLPITSFKKDISLIWNKQISFLQILLCYNRRHYIIFSVGQSEIQSKKWSLLKYR